MNSIIRALDRAKASLAYRVQESLLRRPTFRFLAELRASGDWTPQALETLQNSRLNSLLRTALAHSPWHAARIREAGLEARVIAGAATVADLRLLPTMDKQDARENLAQLVWREVPGGAFRYTTGGSSGQPLIFYYGRARQAADAACRMAARGWWGVQPGDREAYLWGAPVELDNIDRAKRLRDMAVNHLILNAFKMTPRRMDEYLAKLEAWQPRALYGYASSLAMLASHALNHASCPSLPDLKLVCTTGEPLLPQQRETISRAFAVPVANEYGCRDGGLVAHEAPGGQMRVMSEFMVVELLGPDGSPVPAGQPGEVVLTNLASFAQPFVRYRTGDVAVEVPGSPGPAAGIHALSRIEGRSTDFVVAEDGTVMHALALIYEIRKIDGVGEFKCIQHSLRELTVFVVPTKAWSNDSKASIIRGLGARLGGSVDIRLELVAEIPPELSGKHRYVVSHVPLDTTAAPKPPSA